MHSKIDEMIRETKANDASAQVLKDAEEAVMMLHAKVSHMAQDTESVRISHAEELAAMNEKLQQADALQRRVEELTQERDLLARAATGSQNEDAQALRTRVDELTHERDQLAREVRDLKSEDALALRKKVIELEEELRAKEDDFRILRQVICCTFLYIYIYFFSLLFLPFLYTILIKIRSDKASFCSRKKSCARRRLSSKSCVRSMIPPLSKQVPPFPLFLFYFLSILVYCIY